MNESRHTLISAAVAAWLGFPIGAIFATVTLQWWIAWMAFGVLIALCVWAHIYSARKEHQ